MVRKIINILRTITKLETRLQYMQESLGRIEARQVIDKDEKINESEFKVYSQSGEDGIIQYLINKVAVKKNIFIEFGVENYLESNTRFLALNNYWSGLVIDGDQGNIDFIKKDPIYWRCNIKALCSFITKDNINTMFIENGIEGEIGLLSIDIDGNDYWVWDAIDSVEPAIVVAEYNSFFGPSRQITVPYDPTFVRFNAHFSKIFYGASISALTALANQKGYKLVASNKSGNNLFFVRENLMDNLDEISVEEAYRPINFREAHDEQGKLLFQDFEKVRESIYDLRVFDLEANKEVCVRSIWE